MDINSRVISLIEALGDSKSSFAARIGVSPSIISHISSGRNKVGIDVLEKIVEHVPKLSLQWLLSGKGKAFEDTKGMNVQLIAEEINALDESLKRMQSNLNVMRRNIDHLRELIA